MCRAKGPASCQPSRRAGFPAPPIRLHHPQNPPRHLPQTRDLLRLLIKTATDTLQEIFRTRLNLPDGKLGAIAAVHTFGDYLIFHPHLHVLAAILRFRGGSYEWQASGELTEAKNALRRFRALSQDSIRKSLCA